MEVTTALAVAVAPSVVRIWPLVTATLAVSLVSDSKKMGRVPSVPWKSRSSAWTEMPLRFQALVAAEPEKYPWVP